MSERKYQLMYDPTPAGFKYGFPKPVPLSMVGGTGQDLFVLPDSGFDKWVVECGYPEELHQYGRFWVEEIEDQSGRFGNQYTVEICFGHDDEFVTPGQDPQE